MGKHTPIISVNRARWQHIRFDAVHDQRAQANENDTSSQGASASESVMVREPELVDE